MSPSDIVESRDDTVGPDEATFPVVGIGASAGGLEALGDFFGALPEGIQIACLVIQHMDPAHESFLAQILTKRSRLKIMEAKEGVKLDVGCLYTIPPNCRITVSGDTLHLEVRPESRGAFLPIDAFFHSLAAAYGERAVAIVLSGGGSDGAKGLQEVKENGGITFAQDESAKFDSMPQSAISTGAVDFVLSPKVIAEQLVKIIAGTPWSVMPSQSFPQQRKEDAFHGILKQVHKVTGSDFSQYKFPTLRRRIGRRMALKKIDLLEQYWKLLQEEPAEARSLAEDILIQVTRFFRDAESYEVLRANVFPHLVKDRACDDPIRIWVPGCASGEEPYSILMSLSEFMADTGQYFPVQLFGTDINEQAINKARIAAYAANSISVLSPERIRRFFTKSGGRHELVKALREFCIFAKHNVLSDPPFARLDLISCQNVLIYFNTSLQRKALSIFHYALKPSGVLMLGKAETVGASAELFRVFHTGSRSFLKVPVTSRLYFDFAGAHLAAEKVTQPQAAGTVGEDLSRALQIQKEADRLLLSEFVPPGALVNDLLEVIQFRGHTGPFIEHSPGLASLDLLKMLRVGLISEVSKAVEQARKTGERVRKEGIRVRLNGHTGRIAIELIPLLAARSKERFFLLLFEDMDAPTFPAAKKRRATRMAAQEPGPATDEVAGLRAELQATKEYLQSLNEEKEGANEELRAANEEIMSSNEELQSSNEELHTTKEELQSTNEELTTVNDELQVRNRDLSQVSNDLNNLFGSLDVAVVMLTRELRIRKYTPAAEKLLRLIPGDLGRPVTEIRWNLEIPDLQNILLSVLNTITAAQLEAQDSDGRWFSVQVRPYRTSDDRIDGLVLLFIDLHAIKTSLEYAEAIEEAIGRPLLILSGALRVKKANSEFYKVFGTSPESTENRFVYDLGSGEWNIPELKHLLEDVLPKNTSFNNFEVTHEFPGLGKQTFRLNARRLFHGKAKTDTIILVFEGLAAK